MPDSIELFTGAGGLALGVATAGFAHRAVIEWDRDACNSLRDNAKRIDAMKDWIILEGDVQDHDFRKHDGRIDLLAAGVPCQPFSLGGKHRGQADKRNMFPEVFRAVRESRPPAVIVENVKGLLRPKFRSYFEYVLLHLRAPDMLAHPGEDWIAHKERLQAAVANGDITGTRYDVTYELVNAADFGVPQRRDRVFIIAFRSDLKVRWPGLRRTHSENALLYSQYVDGGYWREHGMNQPPTPDRLAARVRALKPEDVAGMRRWSTVRDALRGLPEPEDLAPHAAIANHVGNPGARSYAGHTGSPWDAPAKTLKAGDHGVPGGENMLRHDDGSVRYFTVREAARLQTFPDDYTFSGAWCEGFRQLGNAVPVELARVVAETVGACLQSALGAASRTRFP